MAKKPKLILTCAVTGAVRNPSMLPHLSVTPEDKTRAGLGVAEAGSSTLNLPARDPETGKPT